MSIVVELALLLSRSNKVRILPERFLGLDIARRLPARIAAFNFSRLLPNKSIGLNIVAIMSGVAFLAFALAIYDGYRGKVERIIYSLTPHVMVRPGYRLAADEQEARDETAMCLKVCRAPFSVHLPERATKGSTVNFDEGKVRAVVDWLAANEPKASASRVLFEEAKLEVQSTRFSSEGQRAMRVLGVDTLRGNLPSPRIDLVFEDDRVGERFRAGAGIIISDALADEIERADGAKLVPGRSMLRMGPSNDLRDVQIAGIHHLGIHAISRNLIIAPYALAAQLIGPAEPNGVSYIGLTLADPDKARDVGNELRRGLRKEELAAVAWQSVTDLFDQLELYRRIIFVTLSLSILVTAINTFVNISILIMERVEQIGIMRAMGLSPRRLLAVFLSVGLVQSIIGTTTGYGLGILVGYLLDDYINSLVRDFIPITQAKIAPDARAFLSLLAFVALVSVGTCLLAGCRALKSEISHNLRGA
jgi:ABC-type lipoprotein release transport system permease subunit